MASPWIFPPLNTAALHPLTALMFSSCVLFEALSTNLTKQSLTPHTHIYNTHEGPWGGGTPGLVPGRDLFFTWLQLNYSRQLEPSLPLRTTLLAADLVPADDAVLDTHLTVPSEQPWPLNRNIFFSPLLRPPLQPSMFSLLLLLIMVHTETVWRGLPSGADIIFPVLEQKIFELGDVSNLPK